MTKNPTLISRVLRRLRHQSHANPYYAEQHRSDTRRRGWMTVGAVIVSVGLGVVSMAVALERQKIKEIRIEGLQYLAEEEVQRWVREALTERSFLGIQKWYKKELDPQDIVRHLPDGQLTVQEVKREGATLILSVQETLLQAAWQQGDQWHLLGIAGEELVRVAQPPEGTPQVTGFMKPAFTTFITDMNNILRRNNQATITSFHCDEESRGAWCTFELQNKTILIDDEAQAEQVWQTLQALQEQPATSIDLRFGQRVYLR